jgi:LasA protease
VKKYKFSFLLFICVSLLACNFPMWTAGNVDTTPQAMFRTQIPHNVNFPTKIPTISLQPSPPALGDLQNLYTYASLSGDTLKTVARHFGADASQISFEGSYPTGNLLPPGTILFIPKTLTNFYYSDVLLPDSEVIYSATAKNFDIAGFVSSSGGYLSKYEQKVSGEVLTGSQIVERVALNTSVNPRLLLAFIELRSNWVTQTPPTIYWLHPLDLGLKQYEGLYLELTVAARLINTGYYGWRNGEMTDLIFADGTSQRIAPNLNAGTVGIQYLMAQLYDQPGWETMVYGPTGLVPLHTRFFGDAFTRAKTIEPLFNEATTNQELTLPFAVGQHWALTGGLHYDWTAGTPLGALDFAPLTGEAACAVSKAWVLAAAQGTITRAANNQVIIAVKDDLGNPTGWEVFYLHIAEEEMVTLGKKVRMDDQIGHPSCQGGSATGTHVHITRKYKGEWIGSGEPFPFILSGWLAVPGEQIFKSTLVKGNQTITADPNAAITSHITR